MAKKCINFKKMLSLLLALTVIFSSLIFAQESFAYTRNIFLDKEEVAYSDGPGDMVMFRYRPDQSGMYTFLQTNSRRMEAYLFVKEEQPDGSKKMVQLAFSNSSPNWEKYKKHGHNASTNYCISYHLEAGKEYIYGVSFPQEHLDKVEVKCKLINEGYDDSLIDFIEAECPTHLTWFTDGEWKTDSNKNQYYYYNISKIVSNTKITIHYADGTVKTATGVNNFDGLNVSYNHNQTENHWYDVDDPFYISNDLTVKILDKTATINVVIDQAPIYAVQVKIVDYFTNEPVENASISLNSQLVAKSDVNGNASFTTGVGNYDLTVETKNSINRVIPIVVSKDTSKNNFTTTPFKILNVDYVNDEVINTKDSAFVFNQDMLPETKESVLKQIDQVLGADKSFY